VVDGVDGVAEAVEVDDGWRIHQVERYFAIGREYKHHRSYLQWAQNRLVGVDEHGVQLGIAVYANYGNN